MVCSSWEIDTVLVKGKTIGAKIYWPIPQKSYDNKIELRTAINTFSQGLQFYYEGDWKNAYRLFADTPLALTGVFKERTQGVCPEKWDGIWKMTNK